MKIEILGTGCTKCRRLYERVQKAVTELGINAEVVKVENMTEIINYGVMKTPALAVNGKVEIVGRIPKLAEIKALIS
ncbi:TM0996/MTH895 family glutaredoxin-like protein [Clostridium sp. 'deep sea']|uniref:thioredoxin family protein n=1 Tax=Clostridium sp. 'deep sea' TaxID=2779445 RepID=UPI0018965CCC|nr:thioredoxin family protein [Clostridium sp. 'deep sea']QOR34709.1 TM0996/MTH895 family glutaredoxin-like protein [Clostridium sp. 'deep sea']